MKNSAQQVKSKPFNGCQLSVQLNGLNVLTISESHTIQEVLSFLSQKEEGGAKNVAEH